jgi:hypothetical protein
MKSSECLAKISNSLSLSSGNFFFDIDRHDGLGASPYSCSQDVTITRVWQLQLVNKVFVARYKAVGYSPIEQADSPVKGIPPQIWSIPHQSLDAFFIDLISPSRETSGSVPTGS